MVVPATPTPHAPVSFRFSCFFPGIFHFLWQRAGAQRSWCILSVRLYLPALRTSSASAGTQFSPLSAACTIFLFLGLCFQLPSTDNLSLWLFAQGTGRDRDRDLGIGRGVALAALFSFRLRAPDRFP